jgi:DNA ligase-associated metallophosphoesterase
MFTPAGQPQQNRRSLAFEVNGARLQALGCGALWWADEAVLVASDLHLEKGSAYAWRGQMLPPYDTRATLDRLAALVDELQPRRVISLGDSFHDNQARLRMHAEDAARVAGLTARCDWTWIVGNHDPSPPDDLGGGAAGEVVIGPLVFRHEPAEGEAWGEICGHLHPCARVAGRGRSVRTRCFVTDGRRMVMPSYGAFTGGLNVLDAAVSSLFPRGFVVGAIGRDGVYAAAGDRLLAEATPGRRTG